MIKFELKKIFNIKIVLVIFVLTALFYNMFLSTNYFATSNMGAEDKLCTILMKEYGIKLPVSKRNKLEEIKQEYIEKVDKYIAGDEVLKNAGITNYKDYKSMRSEEGLDDKVKEKLDDISFGSYAEETFLIQEVDYWQELTEIMDWTTEHVTSTIFLCWAAQASLYHFYGLKKRMLDEKMFGLFWHKVLNRKIPLVRGFDDMFLAPHSRHTEVPIEDIHNCKELTVLAESEEAGLFLAMADGGRRIFVMGHPEYDRVTLDGEYKRDVSKNLPIEIPKNYYKDNDPANMPLLMWRAHANNLYTNWLNYYVYQSTPFDLYGTPDFEHI